MRVGVIGTGFGARVVAPVFAATRGCEVVDVVSARDTDAIERLGNPDELTVTVHAAQRTDPEATEGVLVFDQLQALAYQ